MSSERTGRRAGLLVLCVGMAFLLSAPARGQVFIVQSASVSDGQVNVPLTDSLIFTFSKKLPFSSLFARKFSWEPAKDATTTYIFLNADRQNPLFAVDHTPSRDFSVLVYGVRAEDGSAMALPFTVNYSTAGVMGDRSLTGSVTVGTRTPPASSSAKVLAELVGHSLATTSVTRSRGSRQAGKRDFATTVERHGSRGPAYVSSVSASTVAIDLSRTIVLLLDDFELSDDLWSVRSAAAIRSDNSYRFDHVWGGTYYPIAINYASADGEIIGAYGYYDPDGDFAPDAIFVSEDPPPANLTMYPYDPSLALDNRDLADFRADELAADQQLMRIHGQTVNPGGDSFEWQYEYFSPSGQARTVVTVDPITVETGSGPSTFVPPPNPIPDTGIINSDQAKSIADLHAGNDFAAQYPDQEIRVLIRGGNLYNDNPIDPTRLAWMVVYSVPGVASRTVLMDMDTGLVYEDGLAVELIELQATVDQGAVTLRWSTASELNMKSFEVQMDNGFGFEAVGFVDAKGGQEEGARYEFTTPKLRRGTYRFRLRNIESAGFWTFSDVIEVEVWPVYEGSRVASTHPNPFRGRTTVSYRIDRPGAVRVVVYDVLARRVQVLTDSELPPGDYDVEWDASHLPTGVYLIRLESDHSFHTAPATLVR